MKVPFNVRAESDKRSEILDTWCLSMQVEEDHLTPHSEPREDEVKKHKLKRRRVQNSLFVQSQFSRRSAAAISPTVSVNGSMSRCPVLRGCSNQAPWCGRHLVIRLQGQFEVCTKQLLIKWREVRLNGVGVNSSERWQFLCVTIAQRTQRWHLTSKLWTGREGRGDRRGEKVSVS